MADYRNFSAFGLDRFPSLPTSLCIELWEDSVGSPIEDAINKVLSSYENALRQFKRDAERLLEDDNFFYLDKRVRYESDPELRQLIPDLP